MKKEKKALVITVVLAFLVILLLYVLYVMGYSPERFIYQQF